MLSRRTLDSSPATESFRDLLLRHRGRSGLTQRELADRAGANRRTVQDWEAGVNFPSAERLRALIQALLAAGGLMAGHEAAEVQDLWAAVLRDAPRMHSPFDELWLASLLQRRAAPLPEPEAAHDAGPVPPVLRSAEMGGERRQDWGDAPDVLGFVGRLDELVMVRDWVLGQHSRVVGVLGMGGIGKTSFAAKVAKQVAPEFQRAYWRGLRNAPPVSELLVDAIGFLSDQQVIAPEGEARQLAALLELLRNRASLLVLDNFETLLEPRQRAGGYREGFAGYGALLRAIGETTHQSCLVVTSREAPPELAVLGGHPVQTIDLGGLGVPEGQVLLADKHLSGNAADWGNLIARFGGNGLALKLVGESIRQVFGGDIGAFLDESGSGTVFGGIRRLLAEQIERSSAVEREVLRVLAVEREPVTIAELIAELGPRAGRGAVLEAVEALRRRSLVERSQTTTAAAFTLQSVVLEYMTDRLVEEVCDEIARGQPLRLVDRPVIKAQAKDYVRQSQERLIGAPVLQQLKLEHGDDGAQQILLELLEGWRNRPQRDQGYGPGNVVNLLRLLRGDLRGLDLGRLALRQAYLAGIDAQDASLAGAHLSEAVLAEAFDIPIAVAISSDGTYLATGTVAGEIWLWGVVDRTPLMMVRGHTGPVFGVALSGDGRLLASSSHDGTVRLWEVPGGRLLETLQGHTGGSAEQAGGIWGVALSADGRLLVSGSQDGIVRLWETRFVSRELGGQLTRRKTDCGDFPAPPTTGARLLVKLQGHTALVYAVAISPDGRLLASASWDGTVRLWEAPGGRLLTTLQGHASGLRGVALSPDRQLVASGEMDGTVWLWEASSGRLLATLQGHTGGVWNVALSADGRLLASGSDDGTVRLWDVPSGRPLTTLEGHTGPVHGVAVSPDGRLLASASWDGTVRLWEPSGRLLTALQGHVSGVRSVALSADGRLVASGRFDGTVQLWEAPSGRLLATLQGHTGPVFGVALSADGRLLASGSSDGAVRLREVPSGLLLATLEGHTSGVRGVALSPDGRLAASGGEDGTIRLWEAPSGRLLATLEGHTSGVRGVALSSDGRLLASGGEDGTIRLWETPSGRLLATLEGHTGPVYSVPLSAAGLLASGGLDGTIRLWEVASGGRLLITLQGHASGVRSVALSADGRLVASAGEDGTIRLWEGPSGRLLGTLQGHTGGLWGVALSTDRRLLASAGLDGTVRLWDPSSGDCLRVLRSDRRYERTDVTGLTGVTAAQRAALLALGAVDHQESAVDTTAGLPVLSSS